MTTAAICDRCGLTILLESRHQVQIRKPYPGGDIYEHQDPDFIWDLCPSCRKSLAHWKGNVGTSAENQ